VFDSGSGTIWMWPLPRYVCSPGARGREVLGVLREQSSFLTGIRGDCGAVPCLGILGHSVILRSTILYSVAKWFCTELV
jgi:hypothetical protein